MFTIFQHAAKKANEAIVVTSALAFANLKLQEIQKLRCDWISFVILVNFEYYWPMTEVLAKLLHKLRITCLVFVIIKILTAI